jgi:hypothetical protein
MPSAGNEAIRKIDIPVREVYIIGELTALDWLLMYMLKW